MRTANVAIKLVGVLIGCPIAGTAVGFIIGVLLLPPLPAGWDGHAAPGDGVLILLCMLVGLMISIVVVAAVATSIIDGSRKAATSE